MIGMLLAVLSLFMGEYIMADTQPHNFSYQDENRQEREGIVVWDQKGVVVLWPDGHCCRFSWAMLRQACQCAECQTRREKELPRNEHPLH